MFFIFWGSWASYHVFNGHLHFPPAKYSLPIFLWGCWCFSFHFIGAFYLPGIFIFQLWCKLYYRKCKMVWPLFKRIWEHLAKLLMHLPFDPATTETLELDIAKMLTSSCLLLSFLLCKKNKPFKLLYIVFKILLLLEDAFLLEYIYLFFYIADYCKHLFKCFSLPLVRSRTSILSL